MHACSSVLPMRCSKHAFQAQCSNLHKSIKKLSRRSDYSHGLNRFNPVSSKAAVLKANASTRDAEVIVVGAGIAGLSAALHLKKKGVKDILVIESGEAVGGRVKTDRVDGFLLDQGFQIFLTGYPEAQAALDYKALDLKPFYAGAKVWLNGSFHQVADPFRHPVDGILSLTNPIGTVFDKILVGLIRFRCLLGSEDNMMARSESSLAERLKKHPIDYRAAIRPDSETVNQVRSFGNCVVWEMVLQTEVNYGLLCADCHASWINKFIPLDL
ncbi:hypothetical protein CEUSTIGMA_g13806.t1 [Chlamydomonas eustigma]|uniref:Amine oxidase domain-containing protein n=1 Tax=Chlamydomonas eustigma TaxID=1157962 RepID=A0A250XTK8_9CHLO|nr:hypothetical protein CEUSTIGMA_g13806.t1 [Chlamydomonas eustigma]|eukprot:GAX86395.1 hypothetical protein CEUSTIGMA_g13806.t1 [Chlamydomonas eustigma]